MSSNWGDLLEQSRAIAKAELERPSESYEERLTDERIISLKNELLSEGGPLVETGLNAPWARDNVYRMLAQVEESEVTRHTIVPTVDVVRKTGPRASHYHSVRLDWIKSTFESGEYVRSASNEIASRYFRLSQQQSLRSVRDLVYKALLSIVNLVTSNFNTLSNQQSRVDFGSSSYANAKDYGALRTDLIVAIHLMIRNVGSLDAATALFEAGATVGSLPKYMIQGGAAVELTPTDVGFEICWNANDSSTNPAFTCSIVAGLYEEDSTFYNSGLPSQIRDFHDEYGTQMGKWITVIIPSDTFSGTLMVCKGRVTNLRLNRAILTCQSSTWLSTSRFGFCRIVEGGLNSVEKPAWSATANNVIVNDLGNGSTPTFGNTTCAVVRMFARNFPFPIVPSIHCILDDGEGLRPMIGRVAGMEGVRYPLILDAKVLTVLPVLFTIFAKMKKATRNKRIQSLRSRVTLSSPFGLASPNDLFYHIDFLAGCFTLLDPLFEFFRIFPPDEQNRIYDDVINVATSQSSDAWEALRKGRSDARKYLMTNDDKNLSYAIRFAWSIVQSATCLIWFITLLTTGSPPVLFPSGYADPPTNGLEAIKYIFSLSFRQWIKPSDISKTTISNINMRLLFYLRIKTAPVRTLLGQCKALIRNSQLFRPV